MTSFVAVTSLLLITWADVCLTVDIRDSAVCHSEFFRAKCAWDELIVIAHAQYGRMRINKCVSENFGYVGCADDVIDVLDRLCSGRRACHVRILDETFSDSIPCHEDLNSYLEVEYQCVRVLMPERYDCSGSSPPINIMSISPTGVVYIPSGALHHSAASASSSPPSPFQIHQLCGSPDSPWTLAASPGQRLQVELLDFDLAAVLETPNIFNSSEQLDSGVQTTGVVICGRGFENKILYGVIGEPEAAYHRPNVTVCGGGVPGSQRAGASASAAFLQPRTLPVRQRTVYESTGHVIEIRTANVGAAGRTTSTQGPRQRRSSFLLKVNVVGCRDVVAPPGGWAVRNDDSTATIGCNDSLMSRMWQLVCLGHVWRGVIHNCTALTSNYESEEPTTNSGEIREAFMSAGVLVGIATALAFALCLSVVAARRILDPKRFAGRRRPNVSCVRTNPSQPPSRLSGCHCDQPQPFQQPLQYSTATIGSLPDACTTVRLGHVIACDERQVGAAILPPPDNIMDCGGCGDGDLDDVIGIAGLHASCSV